MDLGPTSTFDGPQCQLSYCKAERGASSTWDGYARARAGETECERYCLAVRGHGSDECPVLSGFERQFDLLFQRSLACDRPEFGQFAGAMNQVVNRVHRSV